jgi:plastocyanin
LSSPGSLGKDISLDTQETDNANNTSDPGSDSLAERENVVNVSIEQDASDLGNKAFSPNTAIIKPGYTIEWINNDSVIHTVVEGTASIPSDASAIRPEASDHESGFESTVMAQKMTYRHTFDKPGTFNYYCSIHPTMTGVVIVSTT